MTEAFSILQTKLARPPISLDIVSKPSLLERLNRKRQRPLALISALAGFGTSTLQY